MLYLLVNMIFWPSSDENEQPYFLQGKCCTHFSLVESLFFSAAACLELLWAHILDLNTVIPRMSALSHTHKDTVRMIFWVGSHPATAMRHNLTIIPTTNHFHSLCYNVISKNLGMCTTLPSNSLNIFSPLHFFIDQSIILVHAPWKSLHFLDSFTPNPVSLFKK